jgi:protein arginine N-methyltransferase 1
MYSVSSYSKMIADEVRVNAYAEAMRQAIKPDSVVLEIGAGTGFFTMLACQLGARKVYAIEPDGAIQVAREIAGANGYADRIEFIQDLSTKVTLPEPADVIVSDMRGTLPLFQHHIPSIVDARRRLLAPGGVLISRADKLWAAVVEAPELFEEQVGLPKDVPFGIDMQPARRMAINSWRGGRVKPEQFLAPPQVWANLDYTTIEDPDVKGEIKLEVQRPATAHGLSLWFEADLAEGVSFSTGPQTPGMVYGAAFFPLQEPVEVGAGDSISVILQADLVVDDYLWRWTTRVVGADSPGAIKADFKQSTFFGAPLTLQQLSKKADSYVPRLNEDGLLAQRILGLMNDGLTQGEMAEQLAAQYSHRFRNRQEALTYIAGLSEKYCE